MEFLSKLKGRGSSLGFYGLAVLLFSGLLALGVYFFSLLANDVEASEQFVYVEVRAVGESGSPIAGAQVLHGGKAVGVTDSFGQWRRYLKLALGSTAVIELRKNIAGRDLSATKVLTVPPDRNDQSLNIALGGPVTMSSRPGSRASAIEKAVANPIPAEQTAAQPAAKDTDASKVWFVASAGGVSPRLKEVVSELKREAETKGILGSQRSDWQVLLQHITSAEGDFEGLIRISSKGQGAEALDFLRNYHNSSTYTAQRILSFLITEASQDKDQASARSVSFHLPQYNPRVINVFLGGKKCRHMTHKNWRCPAFAGQRVYLSVLKGNKVVQRQISDEYRVN